VNDKSIYRRKNGGSIILFSLKDEEFALLNKPTNIKELHIWFEGQSMPNLDFLLKCQNLEYLVIYGGNIADYSALGRLPKLRNIFMNGRSRRWLADFNFISEIHSLEQLHITNYPMPECFPDLSNLKKLVQVQLSDCKRLTDISKIALIPNLLSFNAILHLEPEDLEFIAAKPGMKYMGGQFGSNRKNQAFESMIAKYGLRNKLLGYYEMELDDTPP
jgi:hypothetical protein